MYIFHFCYHLINRLHGLFNITWPIVFPFHLSVLVSVTVLLLCIPTTSTLLYLSSPFKKTVISPLSLFMPAAVRF